jgi:RNA polymerase sigma-70 factor (ECF subfamily)
VSVGKDLTDDELLAQVAAGEDRALATLYASWQTRVYSLAYAVLQDHHAAEDIAQETFEKLLRSRKHLNDRGMRVAGWLATTSRNAAIDHIRKQHDVLLGHDKLDREDPATTSALPTSGGITSDTSLLVHLRRLPEMQKKVLLLHFYGDLDAVEIGFALGISDHTAREMKYRALKTLRLRLRRHNDGRQVDWRADRLPFTMVIQDTRPCTTTLRLNAR